MTLEDCAFVVLITITTVGGGARRPYDEGRAAGSCGW